MEGDTTRILSGKFRAESCDLRADYLILLGRAEVLTHEGYFDLASILTGMADRIRCLIGLESARSSGSDGAATT